MTFLLPTVILIPFVAGLLLCALKLRSFRALVGAALGITVLTSGLCWTLLLVGTNEPRTLARFSESLSLVLRLDGLSRFFIGIVATLWPLTVLYARSYMKDEAHLRRVLHGLLRRDARRGDGGEPVYDVLLL